MPEEIIRLPKPFDVQLHILDQAKSRRVQKVLDASFYCLKPLFAFLALGNNGDELFAASSVFEQFVPQETVVVFFFAFGQPGEGRLACW